MSPSPSPTTFSRKSHPASMMRRQWLSQVAPSSASSSSAWDSSTTGASSGPTSSSLYLFTFLITIIVLGLIAGALLIRAYRVRRRFQIQVQEAIQAGRPLPEDAVFALGLFPQQNRNAKKEKKHGPMPSMWESEMNRSTEDSSVLKKEDAWADITPLCITREPTSLAHLPPPPPPADTEHSPYGSSRRRPWYIRPFLAPDVPDLGAYYRANPGIPHPAFANRPGMARAHTTATLPQVKPQWTIPEEGEEVVVGVLIAMPGEGQNELWDPVDPEEAEIPDLALGVVECTVDRH